MGPRSRKFQQASKSHPSWLQQTKQSVVAHVRGGPPEAEIQAAVRTFRIGGALCFLEGLETNEGFGIAASFNPVRHQGEAGTIELAPKSVTLRFDPPGALGWSWCESAVTFGKEIAQEFTVRMTDSASRTDNRSGSGKVTAQEKGKIGLPMLGDIAIEAAQEVSGSRSASDTSGRSREYATVDRQEFAEFNRDRKSFSLKLSSPDGKDLVRLNPELNRLSVLAPPSDHTLEASDIKVTMAMRLTRLEQGVEHAFAIREASGCWSPLSRSKNKKILTELLFSKFLAPMHKDLQLWPPKTS